MMTGYGGSTSTSTVTGSVTVAFRVSGGDRRGCRWGFGARLRRQGRRTAAPRRAAPPPPGRLRILQTVGDVAYHRAGVSAVGVDAHRRDPPVQRNPFGHQGFELLVAIAARAQRPHGAAAGAAPAL